MSLKIIVADSEPKSAPLLRAVATPLGHFVLPFQDYEEAAQKGEAQRFDVAFLGMRPPELTGISVAHRLRASTPNRETAIVMVTSTDDIPTLREAFCLGADIILTEPVQGGSLQRMLAAMSEPGWSRRKPAARLPLFTEVTCSWLHRTYALHSLNISESGMLLRPSIEAPAGEEVVLEFKIAEVHASVNVRAKIVRKDEATKLLGVEFTDIPREVRNTIQVYVMGHTRIETQRQEAPNFSPRRLYNS